MQHSTEVLSSKRTLSALSLVALPALVAACGGGEDYLVPDQQALIEDTRYMMQVFEEKSADSTQPYIYVDLSDDRQYSFVLHRLLAAGNTPKTSPQLFARLENARARAIVNLGLPLVPEGDENVAIAKGALSAVPCTHFIPMEEFYNQDENRFRPRAIVSCSAGIKHTYADLTAFKTNLDEVTFQILGTKSGEAFGGPNNFDLTLSEPDPDKPGVSIGAQGDPEALFAVDSMSAVTDVNDNQAFTYITIKTVGAQDISVIKNKKYLTVSAFKDKNNNKNKIDHPTNIINYDGINPPTPLFPDSNDRIRFCLDRGYASQTTDVNRDCDYLTVKESKGVFTVFPAAPTGIAAIDKKAAGINADKNAYWPAVPSYSPGLIYVPYKGSYRLLHPDPNCSIESYVVASTQALLVLEENLGFCNTGLKGDIQGSGLAGAFPAPGAFQTESDFNMLAKYGSCGAATNGRKVSAYVTVHSKAKNAFSKKCGPRYASIKITPIDFKKSCFAEGTEVRRADGVLLPVERLQTGDRVIANAEGITLTITAIARGREGEPLVNLYDEDGHDLFLTETHPVLTATRGVVKAKALQPGDLVLTERGTTTLVSVSRMKYDGLVYNFALGTTEELSQVGRDGHTMFAEGYLVGDDVMQKELEMREAAAAVVAARKLSPEWRAEYESARERGVLASAPPVE